MKNILIIGLGIALVICIYLLVKPRPELPPPTNQKELMHILDSMLNSLNQSRDSITQKQLIIQRTINNSSSQIIKFATASDSIHPYSNPDSLLQSLRKISTTNAVHN